MRKILCKLKTSNLTIPKAREEAYKNALLIGGNFSELDTEINFRKADREQQNLSGFKKHNHCKTKPKKKRNGARQERTELRFLQGVDNSIRKAENDLLRKEGKKKPRKYY